MSQCEHLSHICTRRQSAVVRLFASLPPCILNCLSHPCFAARFWPMCLLFWSPVFFLLHMSFLFRSSVFLDNIFSGHLLRHWPSSSIYYFFLVIDHLSVRNSVFVPLLFLVLLCDPFSQLCRIPDIQVAFEYKFIALLILLHKSDFVFWINLSILLNTAFKTQESTSTSTKPLWEWSTNFGPVHWNGQNVRKCRDEGPLSVVLALRSFRSSKIALLSRWYVYNGCTHFFRHVSYFIYLFIHSFKIYFEFFISTINIGVLCIIAWAHISEACHRSTACPLCQSSDKFQSGGRLEFILILTHSLWMTGSYISIV